MLVDVDQFVSEQQGLRLLERSSDLGLGVNRGTSDLGLGGTTKVARSVVERPLTLSKASRGQVPKTGDVEADGGQQGEQGKLLLEVDLPHHAFAM